MVENDELELQNLLDNEETVNVVSGPPKRLLPECNQIVTMSCWLPYLVLSLILLSYFIVNTVGGSRNVDNRIYPNPISGLWTYQCLNNNCIRQRSKENESIVTLETCNMLCASPLLWPKPKTLRIHNKSSTTIDKNLISFKFEATEEVKSNLFKATYVFLNNLPSIRYRSVYQLSKLKIVIQVDEGDLKPTISTNESYSLTTTKKSEVDVLVQISAATYFGARHALETLSQLIWLDKKDESLKIFHDIAIEDKPAFPHRGLMIDTARNYFPVDELLKVLDGMAASKMNVLHLHLTDSVSFPIILPNNPYFAQYGAYSTEMVYTPGDIRGLIEYANIRGIRVILEIDAPSHVNEGWNYADTVNDKIVICGEDDVFKGQLNPDNDRSLNTLRSIYEDLLNLGTDRDNFHIGGDEVDLNCYQRTKKANNYTDTHLFWANFTNEIFEAVKLANHDQIPKNVIIWSSPLTSNYLSSLKYHENLVVQYWYGKLSHILPSGYKIIFSTVGHWYLDCGFGPWMPSKTTGACSYSPWQDFYNYRPWQDYQPYMNQILGGEACLWTEQVEVDSLQTRIWPRTAAIAERLWSDPSNSNDYDVFTRLAIHSERLKGRGIKVAAMWPKWCSLNPGKC